MTRADPSSRNLLELLLSFAAGFLFALGLAIAGMTQPKKVLGFLDFAGDWDPSLCCVMVSAIAVNLLANRLLRGRAAPLVGATFHLPTRRDIDPNLVLGATLFGIGWGLVGYCPGPALSSLGAGALPALLFVASMAVGMLACEGLQSLRKRRGLSPSSGAEALD